MNGKFIEHDQCTKEDGIAIHKLLKVSVELLTAGIAMSNIECLLEAGVS